ncbi:MAG: hypothetical protein E7214_11535 [Clostridium sp.]|nr:hypothetical protein [Clostridium sp.]
MKYLYIWDDIPVFYDIPSSNIESKILTLFDYLNNKGKCKYTLFSRCEFNKWVNSLDKIKSNNVIAIGTRPALFKPKSITSISNIKPKRIISQNGSTDNVILDDLSKSIINDCIKKNEDIHFIEDVVVGGRTIKGICDYLDSQNYKGKKIFHVFTANKSSVDKLESEYLNEIIMDVGIYMEEEPIKGSTLLCCSDLLYGKLGSKPYIERTDLLKMFFFEDIDKLVKVVKEILEYVNSKKLKLGGESLNE